MAENEGNRYDVCTEVAPGVARTDYPHHIHFEGTREAMEACGLIPPAWMPPAANRRRSHLFVHEGRIGNSCEYRRRDGFGFVSIELDRGGKPDAQSDTGLARAAKKDRQLQRFLRDAAKLRLVEAGED